MTRPALARTDQAAKAASESRNAALPVQIERMTPDSIAIVARISVRSRRRCQRLASKAFNLRALVLSLTSCRLAQRILRSSQASHASSSSASRMPGRNRRALILVALWPFLRPFRLP
jgi:hypothetical protein